MSKIPSAREAYSTAVKGSTVTMVTSIRDKMRFIIQAAIFLLLVPFVHSRRHQDPREAMQQVQAVMNLVQAIQNQEQGGGGGRGGGGGGGGNMDAEYQINEPPLYAYASPDLMHAPMYGVPYAIPAYPSYDYVEEPEPEPEKPTRRPARSRTREKQAAEENEPLSFRNVLTTFVRNLGWAFTSDNRKK